MNPFVSKINSKSWEIPVCIMCLVLGVMISMAWIKPSTRHLRDLDPEQAQRMNAGDSDLEATNAKLSARVNRLMDDNTKLQNAIASESNQGKVLNQSLQEIKLFAGLTEVEGPGITITLRDDPKPVLRDESVTDAIVHDSDVLATVNELWAAGAEAISVNNHRVSIGSSFRCVGPTILVDGARIASPVIIRAVGDADTLEGGMNLPGGQLDLLRHQDPAMVQIEKEKKLSLPAFTGSTQHALLTVPKESK